MGGLITAAKYCECLKWAIDDMLEIDADEWLEPHSRLGVARRIRYLQGAEASPPSNGAIHFCAGTLPGTFKSAPRGKFDRCGAPLHADSLE